MKISFLFFSLVFCIAKSNGQTNLQNPNFKLTNNLKATLQGKITDTKSGTPLANATISITDIKQSTSSDATGYYQFLNIPEGKHLVEISYIGYATLADYVDVIGNSIKDFKLDETAVENNTVVVTGSSSSSKIKYTPTPISVLNKTELLKISTTNIIEALTKEPGVATISTGPAISKPVIRGLGYNRVLVINDGIRQEGQQWGDEHGN